MRVGRGEKVNSKKQKVSTNVRITVEQKQEIKDLAEQNNNTYADMFRQVLTLGIQQFKKILLEYTNLKGVK